MTLPIHAAVAIDEALLQALIHTANKAADSASAVTLPNFRQLLEIDNKDTHGGFDPVTIADKRAEQAIRREVLAAFPEHGFLGEESEAIDADRDLLWVVDPIDGTRAYITGVPLWGTLIAVYNGDDVVLGLLDQPFLKERIVGTPNGTHMYSPKGDRKLRTRDTESIENAIVQTTCPDLFTQPDQRRCFEALRDRASMTRYGGDCYCYALLAMGFVDIAIEVGLQPYDIQALIPIVRGAGGVITDWQGGSAAGGGSVLACANPALHAQVLQLIAQGSTGCS